MLIFVSYSEFTKTANCLIFSSFDLRANPMISESRVIRSTLTTIGAALFLLIHIITKKQLRIYQNQEYYRENSSLLEQNFLCESKKLALLHFCYIYIIRNPHLDFLFVLSFEFEGKFFMNK